MLVLDVNWKALIMFDTNFLGDFFSFSPSAFNAFLIEFRNSAGFFLHFFMASFFFVPQNISFANEYLLYLSTGTTSNLSNVTMLSATSLLHNSMIFNRNNTVATQQGMKTYWLWWIDSNSIDIEKKKSNFIFFLFFI